MQTSLDQKSLHRFTLHHYSRKQRVPWSGHTRIYTVLKSWSATYSRETLHFFRHTLHTYIVTLQILLSYSVAGLISSGTGSPSSISYSWHSTGNISWDVRYLNKADKWSNISSEEDKKETNLLLSNLKTRKISRNRV